jgi:hypothetical protein
MARQEREDRVRRGALASVQDILGVSLGTVRGAGQFEANPGRPVNMYIRIDVSRKNMYVRIFVRNGKVELDQYAGISICVYEIFIIFIRAFRWLFGVVSGPRPTRLA